MTAGPAPSAIASPNLRRLPRPYLWVAALVPLALLAVLGVVLLGRLPSTSPTTVGSLAPDFSLADLDGNPQPVIEREEKSEMAVTVGADGFSYTRKADGDAGPAGEAQGFKLGAQV